MDDQILTIYCLCDDLLKSLGYKDHAQSRMNNAEVMTVAIVAALHFGGNFAKARKWLHNERLIPEMLSKSRFSRRLHNISHVFITLFQVLGEIWKQQNQGQLYIVDTFPIPVCDNIRIRRCKIYTEEKYRGFKSSKRRFFYGLKLHMLVTKQGQPVEFLLSPGSVSDTSGLYGFDFDLPEGSSIIGDKAYNIYWLEDIMKLVDLHLWPMRKKNSKRPHPPWVWGLQSFFRQLVETAGSLVERLLPRSIHATNSKGFELKITLFVLGFSLDRFLLPY